MQQLHTPTQSIKQTSLRRKFISVIEKARRWAFQIERRAAIERWRCWTGGGGHKSTPFAPFPNGLGRRTEDGGRRTEDGGRRGGGRTCGRDRPFPSFPARFRSGDKVEGGRDPIHYAPPTPLSPDPRFGCGVSNSGRNPTHRQTAKEGEGPSRKKT